MAYYYCKHCGQRFTSVQTMTAMNCPRHPAGAYRGRHTLYEGSEKSRYTCKFCGQSFTSLQIMTAMKCYRHPAGAYKGKHEPAL